MGVFGLKIFVWLFVCLAVWFVDWFVDVFCEAENRTEKAEIKKKKEVKYYRHFNVTV